MGHITRKEEFKRALAGATVHDFFNLIAVGVLLPLELAFGYLKHLASFVAQIFVGVGGMKLANPLKAITIAFVHLFFYLSGIALVYPIRFIRMIPIKLAEMLHLCNKSVTLLLQSTTHI